MKQSDSKIRRLLAFGPWPLLVVGLVSGIIAVYALRNNNLTALRLRDNVTQTDQQNGDVEMALRNLREYVYAHMNTNLAAPNGIQAPVQLKYRYDRLVAAEKARVDAANAKIYTDAQNYCEQQIPQGLSGRGRVPCIQDYVTQHGITEQPIPVALYQFNFVAPTWSPDLAGWSLAISLTSLVLFVLISALRRSTRFQVNRLS